MRRELVTKGTSGGCGQFETSPEAIEPEIRTALCERRQTDRLKTNYRIDNNNNTVFDIICTYIKLVICKSEYNNIMNTIYGCINAYAHTHNIYMH